MERWDMHRIRLPRAVTHLLVGTVAVLTAFAGSARAAQSDPPRVAQHPPIPVRFQLAEPAYVTLVIERSSPAARDDAGNQSTRVNKLASDDAGKLSLRVKNLVSNTWYPA